MLNSNKLKNNIMLWKDIKDLPSFTNLCRLSKKYYRNNIGIVLFDENEKYILITSFICYTNTKVDIKAEYFFENTCIDIWNNSLYEHEAMPIFKDNFSKKIQEFFETFCYEGKILKNN